MKRNIVFFTTVILLILVSLSVLVGCMYTVSSNKGDMKKYDQDSQRYLTDNSGGNLIQGEAPMEQSSLQKKFNKYLHADRNTLTIFSEEQYSELKTIRESGKRDPLSYEEILFLVNDSVNVYFKYDKIVLTNAIVDSIPTPHMFLSWKDDIIDTYHGDYSEFDEYSLAYKRYKKMLEDIYCIIYYRIYMHDAGFDRVIEGLDYDNITVIFADDPEYSDFSDIVTNYRMQLLSLNGSEISGRENKELLVSEWEKIVESRKQYSSDFSDSVYEPKELNAPLLGVYHYAASDQSLRCQLFITDPDDLRTDRIFPTNELMNMQPLKEKLYVSYNPENGDFGVHFVLYEESGRFAMSLFAYQSFALTGKYQKEDGLLILYPENVDSQMQGYYSYLFIYENSAWVYSRERSVFPEGQFDIEDGLKFRPYKENYTPSSKKSIIDIKDLAQENGMYTDQAIEPFFEDDKNIYSFPSIRSEYVIVIFEDGSDMPVKEALKKGLISIRDLDDHSIKYYTEKKN